MNQFNEIELTRGHKEYEAQVKNLEGIFTKLEGLFDVTKYKSTFNQIQDDFNNDPSFENDMMFEGMQLEYESLICEPYIQRLEKLTQELEKDLLPFYELHLLNTTIKDSLKKGDDVSSIIKNTISLIEALNSLNTHNKDEKREIIKEVYETIYKVILYEALFNRNDILSYLKKQNIKVHNENIGRLLAKDLSTIKNQSLIEDEIKGIKTEGLGYDFLTEENIQKVAGKSNSNREFLKERKEAIEYLQQQKSNLEVKKEQLTKEYNENKSFHTKLWINKGLLAARLFSFVLIPVTLFVAGRRVGKVASDKIVEYKTITQTYDLETGKKIGEPEIIFDEDETTYVATIKICEPWQRNTAGGGYVRKVSAYEYSNTDTNYHFKKEDLKDLRFKYQYTEPKEILTDEDSTVNTEILVTETFQDKEHTQKSTKYILPFSLVGAGIGVIMDILFILQGFYSINTILNILYDIKYDSTEYKQDKLKIQQKILSLREQVERLQEQYNETVDKFGTIEERSFTLDSNLQKSKKSKH